MSETIKAALERLNPRQREVYEGRVLSEPQVTRSELARRRGIKDDRQIPRIENQARVKIARFLKSVTPR